MPSKAETQVGEVLEAELADDHTHECAQDHDKIRDFALGAPAERLKLELDPHPGAPEQPVPDMSPVGFALSGMIPVTAYACAAILVFALYYVARVAWMSQTLTHVAVQMGKRADVAQGDTLKHPAGRFQPVELRRWHRTNEVARWVLLI
jgi:hypothetical protein